MTSVHSNNRSTIFPSQESGNIVLNRLLVNRCAQFSRDFRDVDGDLTAAVPSVLTQSHVTNVLAANHLSSITWLFRETVLSTERRFSKYWAARSAAPVAKHLEASASASDLVLAQSLEQCEAEPAAAPSRCL